MRIRDWLLIGHDARSAYRQSRQCAKEQAKRARVAEELRRIKTAYESTRISLREAVEDKEQLKGILKVLAPERLAAWKLSRQEERVR